MVLSCSSFGLPSDEDRLSDKEIMSDLGRTSSPQRGGLQIRNAQEDRKEADLDVSFDFLNEKQLD